MVIFSLKCLVVEWEEVEEDQKVHKRGNQCNIPLKLLLRKFIREKQPKLLLIEIEFAQDAKEKEAKTVLTLPVQNVRVVVW